MVCWFANSFYQRSFLHTTLSRNTCLTLI